MKHPGEKLRQQREAAHALNKQKQAPIDHGGKTVINQQRRGDYMSFSYTDGTRKAFYVGPPEQEFGPKSIEKCRAGSHGS